MTEKIFESRQIPGGQSLRRLSAKGSLGIQFVTGVSALMSPQGNDSVQRYDDLTWRRSLGRCPKFYGKSLLLYDSIVTVNVCPNKVNLLMVILCRLFYQQASGNFESRFEK